MSRSTDNILLNLEHSYAELGTDFSAAVEPARVRKPALLHFNQSLADELGLNQNELTEHVSAQMFSGNELPMDARPVAQAYAGHQFGGFVPQLGDGRALLVGEVIDRTGLRRDIALKGSGRTPFTRGGDGKAAVGPVLREYLIGEAMHALGIPTTRALAAVATGEPVMRDRPLPGAVLTRVAASHVRVGTFQYFAVRRQTDHIRKLADYVIYRHYPEVAEAPDRYLSLLKCVVERQASLIANWMLVGFIHGMMNTDNMTISGETIDYGPCAFMDAYNPQTVFSSIDRDGRYAYVNQPSIALWNLARFADTLLPLLGGGDEERAVAEATSILEEFMPTFEQIWYNGARVKLGLPEHTTNSKKGEEEHTLVVDWLQLLAENEVDYTLAWRSLADVADGDQSKLRALFNARTQVDDWIERWKGFQVDSELSDVAASIRAANPTYIPRNHLVEEVLAAASDEGDLGPFEQLLDVVRNPYDTKHEWERYSHPASAEFTANYQTFCGT